MFSDEMEIEKNLYRCLVEATETAISDFVAIERQVEPDEVCKRVEQTFLKTLRSKMDKMVNRKLSIEHLFTIENFVDDRNGQEHVASLQFPKAKYVLSAIFCGDLRRGFLFADTFLPICLSSCDKGIFLGKILWLTNGIPRFLNLKSSSAAQHLNSSQQQNEKNVLKDGSINLYGNYMSICAFFPKHKMILSDAIQVTMLKMHPKTMNINVQLDNGLIIDIDGDKELKMVHCCEQTSPPSDFEAIFVEINFKLGKNQFPSMVEEKEDDCIVFALQAKTMPYREFYRQILPNWSKEAPKKIQHLSKISNFMKEFSIIMSSHLKCGVDNFNTALPLSFVNQNEVEIQASETQMICGKRFLPPKIELDFTFNGFSLEYPKPTKEIRVYAIFGMPNSSYERLAKDLAGKRNSDIPWLGVFQLNPELEEAFDINFNQSNLFSSENLGRIQDFIRSNANPKSSNAQLVIACPFFLDASCFIAKMDRFLQNVTFNDFKVSFKAALLCLDSFSDTCLHTRSINPIIQDHLRPGIFSAVIPYCPNQDSANKSGQSFESISKYIQSINPEIMIFRYPSEIEFNRLTPFWSKEMAKLRTLYWTDEERFHNWHVEQRDHPLSKQICFAKAANAVTLEFKQRVLQKDKLTANLYHLAQNANGPLIHHYDKQSHEASETNPALNWFVWHVAGNIGFYENEETYRLSFTLPQQVFRLTALHKKSDKFFITFYGENLDEKKLKNWLRISCHNKPIAKKHLKLDELAPAFFEKLQEERHLDPLPEGWYYNGTYYVDAMGKKAYKHPSLNDFAKEYVEKFNTEVDQANAEIKSGKFPDLFD